MTHVPRHHIVVLRGSFSNPSTPLKSLISRVLRGKKPILELPRVVRLSVRDDPDVAKTRKAQTRLSIPLGSKLPYEYQTGVPLKEFVERYGASCASIRQMARPTGIPVQKPEHPEQVREEAIRLYTEGLTLP